jgi:uncharacterized RDD family membrane protein YckC
LIQPAPEPNWKQEVNRRIAAHRSHGGLTAVEPAKPAGPRPSSRAVEAAARVAARYAKAPTYSQMQAAEARAALDAAQIATQAALDAQTVARAALDGLEAASADPADWEIEDAQVVPDSQASAPELPAAPNSELFVTHALPSATAYPRTSESTAPQIRWDADFPARAPEPVAARAPRPVESLALSAEDARVQSPSTAEPWGLEAIEPVEAVVPIHANLIEFPRELIATRKVRPRLAEGPLAASEMQLSIFEVDPGAVSIQPEPATAATAPGAQPWAAPEWSGMELESHSLAETLPDDPPILLPALELASFGRRLLAAVVDGALIAAAFFGAALTALSYIGQLPATRVIEVGTASALLLVALFYEMIFFTLAHGTPGMKYARLSLCTFDDQAPTRAQVRRRFLALLASVLPLGLGVAWAIFDDSHLMWHDRLSRTYMRKC